MSLVRNMDHDNDYTQDGWMKKMQNRMIRWRLKNLLICSYIHQCPYYSAVPDINECTCIFIPALIMIIPLRGSGLLLRFFEVSPQVGNPSWSLHHHDHVNTVVTFTFYSYFLALLMYLEQKYGCTLFPFLWFFVFQA